MYRYIAKLVKMAIWGPAAISVISKIILYLTVKTNVYQNLIKLVFSLI